MIPCFCQPGMVAIWSPRTGIRIWFEHEAD